MALAWAQAARRAPAGAFDPLWVVHWPAPAPGPAQELLASLGLQGVTVATCQRQLVFGLGPQPLAGRLEAPGERRTGAAAYALLLEIATGLRSGIPGETNVQGQLRRAWEASAASLPASAVPPLAGLMDALLADTRQVRDQHLQGIGGRSYGSLARLLLRPRRGARVLVVGAGALARSVLPFLRQCQVAGWNHRPGPALAGTEHWFAPEEASQAAAWAQHLIFTTPADAAHDQGWNQRLAGSPVQSLVHLGRRRNQALAWPPGIAAFDLDHLFALAAERENVRSLQLARARAACAAAAARRWAR